MNDLDDERAEFERCFRERQQVAMAERVEMVLKDQYREAFEILTDAENARLIPAIVGPPGIGKTLLLRAYAQRSGRPFWWMTGDEGVRPSHLVGSFNPAVVLSKGFTLESFEPGPLLKAMILGGVFGLNEANRLSEYVQNTLLEPLEEWSLLIPRLGRIVAKETFFPVLTMNPEEMSGTHRLSEALRDRIRVWIRLNYPRKETEIEIIRANCSEYQLSDEALNEIYALVSATRSNNDIETPASIRAGVSIARLSAQMARRRGDNYVDREIIAEAASRVLSGALRFRPGIDPSRGVENIIRQVLTLGRK
ncbi:MAG: MoxR family ATPase [Candidatus Thorarchaeota archaeon]